MSCPGSTGPGRAARWWPRRRGPDREAPARAERLLQLGVAALRAEPAPEEGLAATLDLLGLRARPAGAAGARRRLLRRAALSFGSVVAAVGVASYGWLVWIDIDPNVGIPHPSLPTRNAYDVYNQAAGVLAAGPSVDRALMDGASGRRAAARGGDDAPSTPAERAQLVRANRPALALVRQALALEYVAPRPRSFGHGEPAYARYRSLARLLALEAEVRAEAGDRGGAADSALDAVQMGLQIQQQAPLIGRLVGIACESIGRSALRSIDGLNAQQAERAAHRMEGLLARQVPLEQTMVADAQATLACLEDALRQPGWRWTILGSPYGGEVEPFAPRLPGYLALLPYSKRRILADTERALSWNVAQARGPYRPGAAVPPPPGNPVTALVASAYNGERVRAAADQAENALLAVDLALRAYRLRHGDYPFHLLELTPSYLASIPSDPFAPIQQLHYRRQGPGYVLYSVGPDARDDGGASLLNVGATSESMRRAVLPESQGDLRSDLWQGGERPAARKGGS